MSARERTEFPTGDSAYAPPPPRGPMKYHPGRWPRWPGMNPWGALILILVLVYPIYYWYIVRTEVNANELLVLINKTGRTVPDQFNDQVILYPELVKQLAQETGLSEERVRERYKGVRYEVLREGRYFFSPIWFERVKIKTTLIPESQFGVLVRKYGKPLPSGKTVATLPDERGPVAGTLPPGRHDISTLAYEVQLFNKIIVPEGWIGVLTKLSGEGPSDPNEYVQPAGARGVQPDTLGPGTYFDLNPYEFRIDLVDARSQRYDMLQEEAIEFPSVDGFTIRMEATVEWAVYPETVPTLTVEVGDLEDVVTKVIRPYAMSLARIQGSKMTARDFIGAREAFQKKLVTDLRAKCRDRGAIIKAVNVRELRPPEAVRSVIRERELADQTLTRYENEIAEAQAKAKLVEQEQLANQQQSLGDANREVVTNVVQAEQTMAVTITEATQRLQVARLALEAARKQAEAILARGQADAKVILFNYQAEAEPLQAAVNAFGDGQAYARYIFLQKMAPAVKSILTSTDGPLADIFREFAESPGNAASPPVRPAALAPAGTGTEGSPPGAHDRQPLPQGRGSDVGAGRGEQRSRDREGAVLSSGVKGANP